MLRVLNGSVVVLLCTLISVLAIVPLFKVFSFFNVILYILSISCSFLLLGLHWRLNQGLSSVWYVAHISFGYVLFFSLQTNNLALVGRFSEYLILANSFQFLLYCQINCLENQLSGLIKLSIFAVFASCITTVVGISADPAAARMVADNPQLYSANIGGYGFIYCLLFFTIAIQNMAIPGGLLQNSVFYSVVIVLMLVLTIFMSRFLIAGIFTLGVLTISYFAKRSPFNFGGRMFRFIIGASGVLGTALLVLWLFKNESYLIIKTYEIIVSMVTGSDSSYLAERLEKYYISWQGFVEFPVFGVLAGGGEVFDWQWYGRHSFILDNFALFGVFGGCAFLFILLYPWIVFRRRLRLDLLSAVQAGLLVSFLALINILTPEILVAAYLILPGSALLTKAVDQSPFGAVRVGVNRNRA